MANNQDPALQIGKMVNFPTIVADDFYPNPDEIRKIAQSFEYRKDANGAFPGSRTMPLNMIDPALDQFCNIRFLSLYFDLNVNSELGWRISSYFQIVDPCEPSDSVLNQGWTHVDTPSYLAGVVYLTPNANPDSGTSLYRLLPGLDAKVADDSANARREFYKTGAVTDDYEQMITGHNSKFEESVVTKNFYNRIVAYDGHVWHRAATHYSGIGPRLTQVFFVNDLTNVVNTPYDRLDALPSLADLCRQMQPKLSLFNGKLKFG